MSISGPSPLGTLMVQRVEAALGATVTQQANIATGARPDAVTPPGQPEKTEALQNPAPKEQEGARQSQGRQGSLAALARNNPEIAKLLAARNAPMTNFTASAPTTLGQAAKTILALLQQFPDARPAVSGRVPLLPQAPTPGGGSQPTNSQGSTATSGGTTGPAARPVGGNLDPRAVEAIAQRAAGGGNQPAAGAAAAPRSGQPAAMAGGSASGATATGQSAAPAGTGGQTLVPTGLAGQLAQALPHAMQSSGLFYESHLREFAFGARTLEQMRAEPQAQAGREPGGGTVNQAAQSRGGAETASPGVQAGSSASASQAQAALQTGQAGAQLAGALLSMDPSTHALVRQQLETLANQAFAWQGEAWPGGELEWEVRRREPQGEGQETDTWSTRLKLNLPGLGEVVARISLADSHLIMHLVAPESAAVMADHTGLLREQLGLHGLQLSQLTISRDTETPDGAAP